VSASKKIKKIKKTFFKMNSKEKEKALINELKEFKEKGLISTPTKLRREEAILSGQRQEAGILSTTTFNPVQNSAFEGVRNYREMAAGTRADQISIMRKTSEDKARGVGAIAGSNYVINFTCFQFKEGKYKTLNIPKKVVLC
jgi:hypothetical protein